MQFIWGRGGRRLGGGEKVETPLRMYSMREECISKTKVNKKIKLCFSFSGPSRMLQTNYYN